MKRQPALRRDLVIIAQTYQGETSYVVKNPGDLKYFRFRALEVAVMQEFNGTNTPEDIVRLLADSGFTLSLAAVEGFGRKLQQPAEAAKTWEPLLGVVDSATAGSLLAQVNAAREGYVKALQAQRIG